MVGTAKSRTPPPPKKKTTFGCCCQTATFCWGKLVFDMDIELITFESEHFSNYPFKIIECLYRKSAYRSLDHSLFVSLFIKLFWFVLILYCNASHVLRHVTLPANRQLYTIKKKNPCRIKITKDFWMRLLKRGDHDSFDLWSLTTPR